MCDVICHIICPVQAQGTRTVEEPTQAAITARHTTISSLTGKEKLHVHFLKPSRLEVVQEQLQDICYANIADQSSWIIELCIPLSAGFHQTLLRGLEITMVRSLAYHCLVYTSAQRQMYWGEPLSSPVSSTATPT